MPSDVTEMKEEQQIMGLEELGLRDKSKGNEIVDLFFYFDRLDTSFGRDPLYL